MQHIDADSFKKRFLLAFSIAMFAIPTIGAFFEIFLGIYSLEEILQAVANYTIFYVLGVYGIHRLLSHYTGQMEQAVAVNDQAECTYPPHGG